MAKSRARPDAAEAPPPAKRRKAVAGGFEDILLNAKAGKKLAPAHTTKSNGLGAARVKEGNVTVSTANGHGDVGDAGSRKAAKEVVDISSDSSSDDDDEEEEDLEEEAPALNGVVNGTVNGTSHPETGEEEAAAEAANNEVDRMDEDDAEDEEEATFGERLHAQTRDPIDVEGILAQAESSDEARHQPSKALTKFPTGATFSTVLTQALRTNDNALLETCFNTHDLESVRETLSRMDSRLVVGLMQRIAERISKAPGRLGNLMVWIQWAVIAHGGYLAGQPDISKRLAALHRVIEARAQGLQPLLQLKGKLDMLAAQFDLRRDEQERNVREEEDEEGAVAIYVEGEEDAEDLEDSDEDELDEEQRLLLNGLGGDDDLGSDDEATGLGAFANGVVRGDLEASGSSDDEDGFIDDEASESDGDEESDEEEGDSDEDSE